VTGLKWDRNSPVTGLKWDIANCGNRKVTVQTGLLRNFRTRTGTEGIGLFVQEIA